MAIRGKRRFVSVGTKLGGAMLAVVVLGALYTQQTLSHYERETRLRSKDVAAQMVARLFAANLVPALVFSDAPAVAEAVASLSANEDVVYGAAWAVVGGQPSQIGPRLGEFRRAKTPFGAPPDLPASLALRRTPDYVVVDLPVTDPTSRVVGVAEVAFSLARENADIRAIERQAFFVSLAAAAGLFALLFGISRYWIVLPLARLADAASAIERGERARPDLVESNDEVGSLASAFEAMREAIEARERRIHERTEALTEVNGQLRDEVREREDAQAKLAAKNEELRAFAYTVSHDLKAPLRGIAGYSQELRSKHAEGLSERGNFCVEQIRTATLNLDALIEDLLQYSRLETERPLSESVDLDAMVREIVRERAGVSGSRTRFDIELEVRSVEGWRRGLFEILSNLIENAAKYSRKVEAPHVEIRSARIERGVRITVKDNGIGFDMKYHDRIFGLFNRLVRPGEFEGTGAGLAIAKKLATKLGATLRAESEEGKGAAFILDLPANVIDAPEPKRIDHERHASV